MSEKPEICPSCASRRVADILYGLPDFNDDLERRLDAGVVVLGGCVISRDDPAWCCLDCDHHWGELDRPDEWFDPGDQPAG